MFSLTVWIFLGVCLLAFLYLRPKKRGIDLPGPWKVPIFGNLFQMDGVFWKTLVKWSEKYGPLCTFSLGMGANGDVVVVADPVMAKEMLAMDAFTERAYVGEFILFEGENLGLINSSGEVWEQQRRFVLRQLRDFGFAKSSMESITMEEVNEMIDRLAKFKGKPVENMRNELSLATVNALWSIVAGTRYSQTDRKLRDITKQLTGAFDEAPKAIMVIAIFPWIKYLLPEQSGYNAIRKLMKQLADFVGKTVKEHQETHQEDSSRDFIDVYLTEIKKTQDPNSSFHKSFAEKQLIAVVADLFQAGADTISGIINWGLLYLLKYPEIQQKLYAEVQNVVGNSRSVSFTDKPKMPYTFAFINEVLRKASPPFGVPHRVAFDTEYRGIFFPKGTGIMINLEYIHNDPKHWDNPQEFRPERFLSDDGKSLKKNDVLNPFLVGRRQCPGETLAKDAIFLFLTNFIQKFEFVKDPNGPEPDVEPAVSAQVTAKPYSIIFKERN